MGLRDRARRVLWPTGRRSSSGHQGTGGGGSVGRFTRPARVGVVAGGDELVAGLEQSAAALGSGEHVTTAEARDETVVEYLGPLQRGRVVGRELGRGRVAHDRGLAQCFVVAAAARSYVSFVAGGG